MRRSLALAVAGWLGAAGPALAAEFLVQPSDQNTVRFESHARLESFSGMTHKVQGRVALDPARVADSLEVLISVDMASLDTGIELRNKYMREDHLETGKYPDGVFRGARILQSSRPSLAPGETVKLDVAGEMQLHGVTRAVQVPVELTLVREAGPAKLHIVGRFPVKLADYKIPRPRMLFLRLDEVQHVSVDLWATAKAP